MKFEDMINTIQLGDCYELIKNIPDKSIDLVYIDIPYELNKGGKGSIGYKIEKMKKDLRKKDITEGIDYSILDELCRIMKNIYIYIWCSEKQIYPIVHYFFKKQCYVNYLIWKKDNPIPLGNLPFLSDLEYCLCIHEKGTKFYEGWEHKEKGWISHINTKDKELYSHPTIKPLEFVKKHILNSTKENDIVLDCFCGSGTTCLACKETGRRYIGMEIDKEYHKIAVNRLNGITASGQMSIQFDERGNKI